MTTRRTSGGSDGLKGNGTAADRNRDGSFALPSAWPVADKLSIWPLEAGRYGLDASFQGRSGFELMERHEAALRSAGVKFSLVQELGDAWTLRFGPLSAAGAVRGIGPDPDPPRIQIQRTIMLVM
jgi:hypothetical protein